MQYIPRSPFRLGSELAANPIARLPVIVRLLEDMQYHLDQSHLCDSRLPADLVHVRSTQTS